MNEERRIAQKIRHALNQGTETLDPKTATRLHMARQAALSRQRIAVGGLSLAGFGHIDGDVFRRAARNFAAVTALIVGAVGAYYWNNYQQADENEEIDSALLADDLPINAYLDHGFHAWLESSAPSSPQE